MASWTFDVKPDEFGICDGRLIAQAMVTEAVRQIMPYVNNQAGDVGRIVRALVSGAADILEREIRESGGHTWSVHYEGKDIKSEAQLIENLKRHIESTKDLTEALIERGAYPLTN